VTVTVNQTLTTITVTPATATVADHGTQSFSATALDQFGNPLATQPSFTWSVSGLGSINSGTGQYTAPSSGTGTATVTATSGGKNGSAAVTVVTQGPVASMTITAGTPQSATVSTAFTTAFQVVLKDSAGNVEGAGINVTFTAFSGSLGAGGTFAGGLTTVTVATNGSGVATAPTFTGNGTVGTYLVTATTAGALPVTYTLTNTAAGLPFTDNFNAAGPLNPANWQTMPAVAGFQPGGFTQNGSGKALAGATVVNIADYIGASAADVSITATGITLAGVGSEAGVVARNNGTSFYLATVFDNAGNLTANIYIVRQFGNFTLLGSHAMGALAQPFNLTFAIQGTSLQLFINNATNPQVSVLDATLTTAGKAGLWATPNCTYDSFTVSALVPTLPFTDNFPGDGASSGPLNPSNWTTMPTAVGFQPGGFTYNNSGLAVAGSTIVNISDFMNSSIPDTSMTATGITLAGVGSEAGVVARNNGTSFYLAAVFEPSAGTFDAEIYQVQQFGTFTVLTNVPVSLSGAFNLTFTVQGNTLTLFVNGNQAGLSVMGTLAGTGVAGLWATPGCTYHTFTVAAQVPNDLTDTFAGSAGPLNPSNWQTMPGQSSGFQPGGFTLNGSGKAVAGATVVNIADFMNASLADSSITATGITLAGVGSEAGVVARNNGTSFYLATVFNNNGVFTAQIYIVRAFGNFSVLGSFSFGGPLAQPFNLQFTVQGNALTLFINGVQRVTATDNTLMGPGVDGLWATPNCTFDSFTLATL
jgi:hypothetical protein